MCPQRLGGRVELRTIHRRRIPGEHDIVVLVAGDDVEVDVEDLLAGRLAVGEEEPFTGEPTVAVVTEDGHPRVPGTTQIRTVGSTDRERPIADDEWDGVLAGEFELERRETRRVEGHSSNS